MTEPYELYVNADQTVMVRQWDDGTVEVATRDHPGDSWGPPITVVSAHVDGDVIANEVCAEYPAHVAVDAVIELLRDISRNYAGAHVNAGSVISSAITRLRAIGCTTCDGSGRGGYVGSGHEPCEDCQRVLSPAQDKARAG